MEPKTVRRDDGAFPARHIACEDPFNALLAGTVVLTLDGAIPAEYLNPGDRVITRDSGVAILRAVLRGSHRLDAVQVRAGSLGNARPDRDIVLPARQEILVRDWRALALFDASQALVPVSRLVDGEFIKPLGRIEAQVVELIFDAPHILYADGLEVASGRLADTPARRPISPAT